MKRKRISMEKLREILRLQEISNLSCREIAAALNISKTVVGQYIGEFKEAKLSGVFHKLCYVYEWTDAVSGILSHTKSCHLLFIYCRKLD